MYVCMYVCSKGSEEDAALDFDAVQRGGDDGDDDDDDDDDDNDDDDDDIHLTTTIIVYSFPPEIGCFGHH